MACQGFNSPANDNSSHTSVHSVQSVMVTRHNLRPAMQNQCTHSPVNNHTHTNTPPAHTHLHPPNVFTKMHSLLTAIHSFISSPSGNCTASLRLPLPRVAATCCGGGWGGGGGGGGYCSFPFLIASCRFTTPCGAATRFGRGLSRGSATRRRTRARRRAAAARDLGPLAASGAWRPSSRV